jgi:hypothetical protein
MRPDPAQSANAEWRDSPVLIKASKLALDRSTAAVERGKARLVQALALESVVDGHPSPEDVHATVSREIATWRPIDPLTTLINGRVAHGLEASVGGLV